MSAAVNGCGNQTTAPIRPTEIQGRGRALVASRPLIAGQIVLRDSPIILYSAQPLITPPPPNQHFYCSHCFKLLNPTTSTSTSNSTPIVHCPTCSSAAQFCSPNCLSTALASSHTPWVCQTLTRLRNHPSLHEHDDRQIQARFLIAAYNLTATSPAAFQTLLSLQGSSSNTDAKAAAALHCLILPPSGVGNFSVEMTAALLEKDKLNAFGLMEPFAEEREKSVRAYGIYPNASLFNHDCLPNACRFDYVDTAGDPNTDIVVRVLHDVPEGREICLSYFPVNFKYVERQLRLREDYGFICECDRCKVEANWSDQESGESGDVEEEEEEEEAMEEDLDEQMGEGEYENGGMGKEGEGEDDSNNDFPHEYFFLRYVCDRENCWGTLAPLPPSDTSASSVMECSVCGKLQKEEEVSDGDSMN